jgi:hypothetical protein
MNFFGHAALSYLHAVVSGLSENPTFSSHNAIFFVRRQKIAELLSEAKSNSMMIASDYETSRHFES